MDELHRQWGRNIALLMKLQGFRTHKEFADALTAIDPSRPVDRSTVTRWIRGDRAPSDRRKLQIARALKTEIRTLFPMFVEGVA
jgi:transcriptional regulator with XRE-family HTH domain